MCVVFACRVILSEYHTFKYVFDFFGVCDFYNFIVLLSYKVSRTEVELQHLQNQQEQELTLTQEQEQLPLLIFANSIFKSVEANVLQQHGFSLAPMHTKSKLPFGAKIFDYSDPTFSTDPAFFAARALLNLHKTTN